MMDKIVKWMLMGIGGYMVFNMLSVPTLFLIGTGIVAYLIYIKRLGR